MERARTFRAISLRGHKLVQVFQFAHANIFPCLPAIPLYLSRLPGCFSPKGVPNSSWHRVNGRIASSFSRNASLWNSHQGNLWIELVPRGFEGTLKKFHVVNPITFSFGQVFLCYTCMCLLAAVEEY